MSPGWRRFFFEDPYPFDLDLVEARDDTGTQVRFVAGLAAAHSGIVDLGCGSGRHARRLSALGYDVIGVDAAPAGPAGPTDGYRRLQADLAAIPLPSASCSFLICLYSSAGYDGQLDIQLQEWARIAVPGASLLLDFASRGRRFKWASDQFPGGAGRMLSVRWCERRYQVNVSWHTGTLRLHSFNYVEPSFAVLHGALQSAGWKPAAVFGDYDGSELRSDSARLLVRACRL